ncbi:MAG: type II toxin-antitoxin system RelE/ParE family toxin [Rhizomicrobium sp.]|jgi:addiction module RelE/StbE family toxin
MRLRFTPQATRDIAEIADTIRAENPVAAQRVRGSILDSLSMLTQFPLIGRAQSVEGVRKIITRRYRYLVYYTIDDARDEVIVLTVQHPSRDQRMENE